MVWKRTNKDDAITVLERARPGEDVVDVGRWQPRIYDEQFQGLNFFMFPLRSRLGRSG
jgi:hypothetical protein